MKYLDKFKDSETRVWMALLALAFVIRVLDGIRIPLFMDEAPILYNVAYFIKHKTLVPSHFSYPTFFSYLITLPVIALFLGTYLLSGFPLAGLTDAAWIGFLFDAKIPFLALAGRGVSLGVTLATIYLVFRHSRKRDGVFAAVIAGLILAVDPFGGRYVAYGRYCLPDVTSAFLVTLGMLSLYTFVDTHDRRRLFFAAAAIGLAISTKYNAGMAVIPVIGAFFMERSNRTFKTLLFTGLFLLGGFIVGSPGWILAPQKFIEGYLYEARHMADGHLGGHDVDWLWVFTSIWQVKTFMLPFAFGAVIYAFIKREKRDILFLLLLIPSFLYIGQFEKKAIHYFLFLYPALAMAMGRSLSALYNSVKNRGGRTFVVVCAAGLFLIYPGYRMALMIKRDLMVDNRLQAQQWIEKNVASGASLLLDELSLRHLSNLDESGAKVESLKQAGSNHWQSAQAYFEKRPMYRIQSIRHVWEDARNLTQVEADYILASYENYGRFFIKDENKLPDPTSSLYEEFHRKKDFYFTLFDSTSHPYRMVEEFNTIAGPEVKIFKRSDNSEETG